MPLSIYLLIGFACNVDFLLERKAKARRDLGRWAGTGKQASHLHDSARTSHTIEAASPTNVVLLLDDVYRDALIRGS